MKSQAEASWLWAKWNLFDAYMKGCRRFDQIDPRHGVVQSYYLDRQGRWIPQVQEILTSSNKVQGIIQSMDLRPTVKRTGVGLATLRDAGAGQVLASSLISDDQLEEVNMDFSKLVTDLGTAGLAVEIIDDKQEGLVADIEVVHPRELLPFPSIGVKRTNLRGMQRVRIVSLDYLVLLFGDKIKRHIGEMQAFEVTVGERTDNLEQGAIEEYTKKGGSTVNSGNSKAGAKPGSSKSDSYIAVQLIETWLDGPRGTVRRYMASSRDYIFQDIDYVEQGIYTTRPVHKAVLLDTGGFYGAGYIDVLFSIVRQFEQMLQQAVQNAKDHDRYPVTLLPAGTLNPRKFFHDDGTRGLQFGFVDVENKFGGPNSNIRPITIAPHNVGVDLPGRTASYILELVDRYSLVGDLGRDKGRIDSLPALQYLDESNKRPMSVPLANIVRAFSGAYKYAVTKAASMLMMSPRPLQVKELTLDLLGAVIDFDKNEVTFEKNPIPDTSKLQFSVRSVSVESPALRKQEAMLMYEKGLQDADRTLLLFAKEGINAAIFMEPEIAALRMIYVNILTLFNDGNSPGQIIANPHMERPDLQLVVLESFMGSPEFRFASPIVQNAFIKYRMQMLMYLQQVLPQPVPDPVENAMLQGLAQQNGGQAPTPPQLEGAVG